MKRSVTNRSSCIVHFHLYYGVTLLLRFLHQRETYWSRISRWIVRRNFQILIVSAVKVCKQSANCFSFWGTKSPRFPPGASPAHHWRTSASRLPGYSPKLKFLAPPLRGGIGRKVRRGKDKRTVYVPNLNWVHFWSELYFRTAAVLMTNSKEMWKSRKNKRGNKREQCPTASYATA